MLGWSIVGQKSLHLIWVGTKSNPADHPSRGVPIPHPTPNPVLSTQLWFMPAAERSELQTRKSNRQIERKAKARRVDSKVNAMHGSKESGAAAGCEHPALTAWTFREIFAGRACSEERVSLVSQPQLN